MHDDKKIIWHNRWHVKWLSCHSVYRRIAFGAGLGRRFISSSENWFTYWETKMMMKRYKRKIWKWGKTCLCRKITIYSAGRWFRFCKSDCDWHEHGLLSLADSSWNVMAHCDAREGKWGGNWRMLWVASTLHTTSEHGVSSITTADAHNSAASSRLNWRPPPI